MKQLFIVPSAITYPTKETIVDENALDLSKLSAGQIAFYQMATDSDNKGRREFLIDKTAKVQTTEPQNVIYDDILFAYGRPNTQIITGVIDHSTYSVSEATPQEGVKFEAKIKVPAPEKGMNYTIQLAKKGVVFHERNIWSATETYRISKVEDAKSLAKSLAEQLKNLATSDMIDIEVTVENDTITVKGQDYQDWELSAADDMFGLTEPTNVKQAQAPMCDKAYVQRLASVCAQNRGFNNTLADGPSIYPGYPMEVTDDWYEIYTIHYKYGRKNARTRDEAPWQDIIIAVGRTDKDTANTETGAAIRAIFDIGIQ